MTQQPYANAGKKTKGLPRFLSRAGRAAGPLQGGANVRLAERVQRMKGMADLRLAVRGAPTQLYPCPECDGCGLHKRACGFFLDRKAIQIQSNPQGVAA